MVASPAMFDLNETARRVFLGTLRAVGPEAVINRKLRIDGDILSFGINQIALDRFKDIILIGMGKASLEMGSAVENMLGHRVKRGILVTDRRSSVKVRSEVVVGGHPLPDANSILAGQKIVELIESCDEHSLVVFLISGGGSALVELPVSESLSLGDLRATNQALVGCGATIREINMIRKSLSRIKGGGLGRLVRTSGSTSVGLYISDVNPGDLRSIASNPLLPEEVTSAASLAVIRRFNLVDKLPSSVLNVLQQHPVEMGFIGRKDDGVLPLTMLLMDNSVAVQAAAEEATGLGFRVEVDHDLIEGEYRTIADQLIARLLKLKSSFPAQPVCVVSGGEVSCSVHHDGIGGRNQEFVLYSAAQLVDLGIREGVAVLSCGSDGVDGNSNATGAVAGPDLVIKAAQHNIDASIFISGNDSHSFFKETGGLVVTGPSGSNVRDLRILMAQ
jgi:glycerate 2-kinase